jgi:hypothetical protein
VEAVLNVFFIPANIIFTLTIVQQGWSNNINSPVSGTVACPYLHITMRQATWSDYQHTYFSTQSCTFAKNAVIFPRRCAKKTGRHRPQQNVTSNRFHMCSVSTHNDGCLSMPDLSVQFPLHRWTHAWRTLWRFFIHSECMHYSDLALL